MIGNVGLLEESTGLSAKEREWLSDIDDAARRATRITRQLLTFGQGPEEGAETVDAGAVLTDMHRMLTRMLGEKIELILTLPKRPACVYIDPVHRLPRY